MSNHSQVTKEELIDALLKTINQKYAQHTSNCHLRLPPPPYEEQYGRPEIVRKCTCSFPEWYIKTQEILNRANR